MSLTSYRPYQRRRKASIKRPCHWHLWVAQVLPVDGLIEAVCHDSQVADRRHILAAAESHSHETVGYEAGRNVDSIAGRRTDHCTCRIPEVDHRRRSLSHIPWDEVLVCWVKQEEGCRILVVQMRIAADLEAVCSGLVAQRPGNAMRIQCVPSRNAFMTDLFWLRVSRQGVRVVMAVLISHSQRLAAGTSSLPERGLRQTFQWVTSEGDE